MSDINEPWTEVGYKTIGQQLSEKDAEIARLRAVLEDACQTFEHNGQHFYASKYRASAREAVK